MGKRIYLDNASTTKVSDEVAKVVWEFMVDSYGNASSGHSFGREAKEAVEKARDVIADFVGCDSDEIVFTSGGTESNNLALRGLAKANPEKRHIVTSVIEHPSVLEVCRDLEREGYEVDYIGVPEDGVIDVGEVEKKIREDTLVVSIMHVNNEIGTIQPIEKIDEICRRKKIYFHCDWVQGFGKVDLDLANVDLASVSGHKVGAPKGVGFLYVRKGVKILPTLTGGGQENGLRSGTENVSGIVGLSEATKRLKSENWKMEMENIRKSRDRIADGLLKIGGAKINGSMENRIYNNINVSFYGIDGEGLMLMLDEAGICVSTGSACASSKLEESYVLKAIGVDDLHINGSIRLTLDENIFGEEDFVVEKIREVVEKLGKISPFKINLEDEDGRQV